jgi:hypothetical protein
VAVSFPLQGECPTMLDDPALCPCETYDAWMRGAIEGISVIEVMLHLLIIYTHIYLAILLVFYHLHPYIVNTYASLHSIRKT